MKDKKPDLIISGVNMGRNIADDILYSGTVGAAMEGALNGIKSIALSQQYSKETYSSNNPFKCATKYGLNICKKILKVCKLYEYRYYLSTYLLELIFGVSDTS